VRKTLFKTNKIFIFLVHVKLSLYAFAILGLFGFVFEALAQKPSCESLSLNSLHGKDRAFENTIQLFEKAILTENRKDFLKILHPQLKKQAKEPGLFEGIVAEFGLSKAKLVRNSIYKVVTGASYEETATCDGGGVKNLVGPKTQIHVFHSFTGGNETIRIHTIYVEIPKSIVAKESFFDVKEDYIPLALAHFFAQAATHGKKTTAQILEEATYWGNLNEPTNAALFSHAALRLTTANPYFFAPEFSEVLRIAKKYQPFLLLSESLKETLNSVEKGWQFLTLSPIFQASSLEVGVKLKMPLDTTVDAQTKACQKIGFEIIKNIPALAKAFNSFECLPYTDGEPLTYAPGAGSQGFLWKEVANQKK
jgi:hypothetical protein